jgi:drug/metabolite transporter (DMT)-like permease
MPAVSNARKRCSNLKPLDFLQLIGLAAIWGGSFMFMRLGAHEFGAAPMTALRVGIASLVLLPVLLWRGGMAEARGAWRQMLVLGLVNSALPFALFVFAALSITAGMSSILNATTPLFGALVAAVWLGDKITVSRAVGFLVAFAGVVFLAWDHAEFKPGGSGWAVLACLVAALCYGVAASYTKKHVKGLGPVAIATGSQFTAFLWLLPLAVVQWPAAMPGARAWMAVVLLAVLCTAVAYLIYFRLMLRVGPTNAIAVTFLNPVFALLWGFLFLDEAITPRMIAGCAIVLGGTALGLGVIKPAMFSRR